MYCITNPLLQTCRICKKITNFKQIYLLKLLCKELIVKNAHNYLVLFHVNNVSKCNSVEPLHIQTGERG